MEVTILTSARSQKPCNLVVCYHGAHHDAVTLTLHNLSLVMRPQVEHQCRLMKSGIEACRVMSTKTAGSKSFSCSIIP